ncbi:DUF1223 domain-containing protein [Flavobacterium sp.]|uniref:DUF1223 domain-containing protein n=1 Tax=Flavobacterium sp. TaxID=239 RepID=UPI003D6BAF35
MKKIKMTTAPLLLSLLFGLHAHGQNKTDKKGFAVLELFTSEGCSSCPPADALMGKIQEEYKDNAVYVLSYHVDYWDRLGWKDIFSNADYTKRQLTYAHWFQKEPIYTPQVVINGQTEHVASQEAIVRSAISNALSKPAVANLTMEANQTDNKLTVNYVISGASKNSRLLLAVVQKRAKSNVKRGENAHRVLSHFQVVHHLHSTVVTENSKGTTSLSLPKGFNTTDFEVIGFIQDINTGAILEATKVIL